jgi:5-methylcytosine-specific restriction enzyme subunit McrC
MEIVKIEPKIGITNLLYMISYTYSLPSYSNYDYYKPTKIKSPLELYIKVFLDWMAILLKKGLSKSYEPIFQKSAFIKGRIDMAKSKLNFDKPFCRFNHTTFSNPENKVIKATLKFILFKILNNNELIYAFESSRKVKKENIGRIMKYFESFKQIEDIILHQSVFTKIKYHPNNVHYKSIIELCELIYSNSYLTTTNTRGSKIFSGFIVDMNKVFEKFIFKILQYKLLRNKVFSKTIPSLISVQPDKRVPREKPDIIIDGEMVIDAKYYQRPLKRSETYWNSNIQQIKSYMYSTNLNGLLVYPENGLSQDSLNEEYTLPNSCLKIKILTIPLYHELPVFISKIDLFVTNVTKHFSSNTCIRQWV